MGPDHPNVAFVINDLALLYQIRGQYSDAEHLLERALAVREQSLGLEYPDLATSLENYAALLRATGRGAEAAKMEVRAQAIRAKHAQDN